MTVPNFNRSRWKKKPPNRSFFFISILILLFFFLFIYYTVKSKTPLIPSWETQKTQFSQCSIETLGERFIWFSPHSGFSNQISELKNAIKMASILNRTLIVPPVLDHHAVALGSCPKFRVSTPKELRMAVWNHIIELLQNRRYISVADIVDLSSVVSSSIVKTIDFRAFASLLCGIKKDLGCFDISRMGSSLMESLKQCGSLLSGLHANLNGCVYALEEDCRTTVWTYKQNGEDEILDSFQPDEQLKKKKKISYIRKRRDVYKALGPGSEAESATVLAFGSLFTAPYKGSELYIDIHEVPRDPRIQSLLEKIEYLPFVAEITSAGKKFVVEKIRAPFLCAQLRLLDGQFKNHWKDTFSGLKQELASLKEKGPLPIDIFVMTDLPVANWTENYLGELASDSDFYKLHYLHEADEFVVQTAEKLVNAGHGMRSEFLQRGHGVSKTKTGCAPGVLPDILLYIEETICSLASLGFVGTGGSTIAESIELMRKKGIGPTLV